MSTAEQVRNHVMSLADGELFASGDVAHCGSRGAVDQAIYRMIGQRKVERMCRGLFMKCGVDAKKPSLLEVAIAKAKAFCRNIYVHGQDALRCLQGGKPLGEEQDALFASDGPTTSFKFGGIRVVFKRTAPRKLHKKDSVLGLLIRGLWSLGPSGISDSVLQEALGALSISERLMLATSRTQMPGWLRKKLLL